MENVRFVYTCTYTDIVHGIGRSLNAVNSKAGKVTVFGRQVIRYNNFLIIEKELLCLMYNYTLYIIYTLYNI